MNREEPGVLAAMTERRHVDGKDIEAIVEVLAETPTLDLFFGISIGGRDDPDIGPACLGLADPLELTFLENTE